MDKKLKEILSKGLSVVDADGLVTMDERNEVHHRWYQLQSWLQHISADVSSASDAFIKTYIEGIVRRDKSEVDGAIEFELSEIMNKASECHDFMFNHSFFYKSIATAYGAVISASGLGGHVLKV